jgi:hypothetical protein
LIALSLGTRADSQDTFNVDPLPRRSCSVVAKAFSTSKRTAVVWRIYAKFGQAKGLVLQGPNPSSPMMRCRSGMRPGRQVRAESAGDQEHPWQHQYYRHDHVPDRETTNRKPQKRSLGLSPLILPLLLQRASTPSSTLKCTPCVSGCREQDRSNAQTSCARGSRTLILERHPATEDDVGVGRGLTGTDHELRPRDHALELFVRNEAEVGQPGRE